MNISHREIQLDNQSYNINRTNNAKPQDSTATPVNIINNQLAATQEGQVFQGIILDVTNKQVKIALDANNVIQAKMAEALTLNIGDELSFVVKENNGQSVYIKPIDNQLQNIKNNVLTKILEQNNLSPSDKNYQIAEGLMNHNMPLDRGSMQRIIQQSFKYPDAEIDNLINMNKLGIPVNESTINQYQDMLDNNHQLSGNIAEFSKSVVAVIDELAISYETGNIGENTFTDKINSILNIISDGQDKVSSVMKNEINEAYIKDTNTELLNVNSEELRTEFNHSNSLLADELSQKLGLDKGALEVILKSFSKAGVSHKLLEGVTKESATPMQLINNIYELADNIQVADGDKLIIEIMKSKSFQGLLTDSIIKKFSLNTESMEDPKELSELYKSIYDKTDRLINSFSDNSGGLSEHMKDSGRAMQERMDFVQNLNEMFGYAQMPVTISGKDMNSELYVYMNKNSRKDLSKEVSALLHLDMIYLGATDVHVSLNGSTVHTRFYVDDEISANIIDEHMTMLEKAINNAGFRLTNEVVTRESKGSSTGNKVVDEVLGTDLEQSIRRYSFDVKM